jgi:hypothetical protein
VCGCVALITGGGEGDERRELQDNDLTGPLPAELGELVNLQRLCVQPHFAMWGQLSTQRFLPREQGW